MEASCETIVHRSGGKTITANRAHLMPLMTGYGECNFLVDEIEVRVKPSGEILKARALFHYDPEKCDYFREHFEGLLPGFGGHGEFMAQTSAAAALLTSKAGGKILLAGADHFRAFYPVRGVKDLVCISRPRKRKNGDMAFGCIVYGAKEYNSYGGTARILSRVVVLGKSVL